MPWSAYVIGALAVAVVLFVVWDYVTDKRIERAADDLDVNTSTLDSLLESENHEDLGTLITEAYEHQKSLLRHHALRETREFVSRHAPAESRDSLLYYLDLCWQEDIDFKPPGLNYREVRWPFPLKPALSYSKTRNTLNLDSRRWDWWKRLDRLKKAQDLLLFYYAEN